MSSTSVTSRWTEITAAGVKRSRRPPGELLTETTSNLRKVRFLVRGSLQREAFGTALGRIWILLEPAMQALMYYVLLRILLGVRGDAPTFVFIYSAITFWRSHAAVVGSSPMALASRGTEILQNNVSLQILYLEFLLTELTLFVMRFGVLMGFLLLGGIDPHWTWLLVPLVVLAQFAFTAACAVWLSMLGIFLPDVGKFWYIFVTLWWYLSPGLYTLSSIPDSLLWLYNLNPFAHIFPAMRNVLIDHQTPDFAPLGLIFGASVVVTVVGGKLLGRLRYRFLSRI